MRTFVVALALALTSGLAAAGGAALLLSITPVIKEPDLQWLRDLRRQQGRCRSLTRARVFRISVFFPMQLCSAQWTEASNATMVRLNP